MPTIEHSKAIPDEDLAALQEAIDRAVKGVRDREAARKACAEMDRAREEMRREQGDRNLGLNLIRQSRDEA